MINVKIVCERLDKVEQTVDFFEVLGWRLVSKSEVVFLSYENELCPNDEMDGYKYARLIFERD